MLTFGLMQRGVSRRKNASSRAGKVGGIAYLGPGQALNTTFRDLFVKAGLHNIVPISCFVVLRMRGTNAPKLRRARTARLRPAVIAPGVVAKGPGPARAS